MSSLSSDTSHRVQVAGPYSPMNPVIYSDWAAVDSIEL